MRSSGIQVLKQEMESEAEKERAKIGGIIQYKDKGRVSTTTTKPFIPGI